MIIKDDLQSKQNYCLRLTSFVAIEIWGTEITFFICMLDPEGKEN